ncbi:MULTISPECIES: hypothetical protein [Cyanophyceae]|nr:hypothetical protein [Nodosilinea sp. FACHB-131]
MVLARLRGQDNGCTGAIAWVHNSWSEKPLGWNSHTLMVMFQIGS